MTRKTNNIQPLPPDTFARILRDDYARLGWQLFHLAAQLLGYRDTDQSDTAAAIYTRQAFVALRDGHKARYKDAMRELLALLDKQAKTAENGE